jgi:hypothetical protein
LIFELTFSLFFITHCVTENNNTPRHKCQGDSDVCQPRNALPDPEMDGLSFTK